MVILSDIQPSSLDWQPSCRPDFAWLSMTGFSELTIFRLQNENLMVSIDITIAPPSAAITVRMSGTSKIRLDLSGGVKSSPFWANFVSRTGSAIGMQLLVNFTILCTICYSLLNQLLRYSIRFKTHTNSLRFNCSSWYSLLTRTHNETVR